MHASMTLYLFKLRLPRDVHEDEDPAEAEEDEVEGQVQPHREEGHVVVPRDLDHPVPGRLEETGYIGTGNGSG